jgi:phage gpG-like protein
VIEGRFDSRQLERALDELGRRADEGWFRELAPAARADQRDHARHQEGPEGRWPRRDPDTVAAPSRKRLRRRRVLGRLPGAIKVQVHPDAIEIRSRVAWSNVHQEGGTAGHGASMPARPFLWWSEEFLETAEEAALIYITRAWSH